MDFAQPHVYEKGVAVRSGIRLLPLDEDIDKEDNTNEDNDNDHKKDESHHDEKMKKKRRLVRQSLLRAANEAATELFLGLKPRPCSNSALVNATLYPEHVLPVARTRLIHEGSLVVLFESFDAFAFLYVTSGAVFQNRNGVFSHDDFIGKPYGSQVRSQSHWGWGFLYLLQPTPELWSRSLRHRTQIVYELDAALVVAQLNLRPNQVVVESGTGSGSMSHFLIRAIAPRGQLHTLEYNQFRVQEARREFRKNGVSHLVQVHWHDVCAAVDQEGDPPDGAAADDKEEENKDEKETTTDSKMETDDSEGTRDVESDKQAKKDNDENKTTTTTTTKKPRERMGRGGFGNIVAPRSVDAIFLDLPEPWLAIPKCTLILKPQCGRLASYSPCVEQCQRVNQALREHGFHSLRTMEVRQREWYIDELPLEGPPTCLADIPGPTTLTPAAAAAAQQAKTKGDASAAAAAAGSDEAEQQVKETGKLAKNKDNGKDSAAPETTNIICSRQAPNLKGHTAFLTFATFGGCRSVAATKR